MLRGMGQARKNRTRLQHMQADQPWCIYCGGTTLGTNVDHMPPTGLFDSRKRWEGMEYLSCEPCREGTRKMDSVAGLMSRLYATKPATPAVREEIRKCFAGAGRKMPEVLNEVRVEKDLRGVPHDAHTALPDAAAVFSTGPLINSYLSAFGARVALALHYELTREILPASGGIFVRWMSNHVIVDNEIPESFLAMLGPPATLTQGKQSLEDQFHYRSLAEGQARSAHFAAFRVSFAIQAFVLRDFNEIADAARDLPERVFRPGFLVGFAAAV
jgi:hypothetical protein